MDSHIFLGTSSFTATGWEDSFYPRGLKSSDYLAYYAEHFDSVEVDSTFYACPSAKTVSGWFFKTPDSFIFWVKVPQTITHDKVLVDCDAEWKEFLETMGQISTAGFPAASVKTIDRFGREKKKAIRQVKRKNTI